MVKALIDSGASASLLLREHAKGLHIKASTKKHKWATAGGPVSTTDRAKSMFRLPELHMNKTITSKLHITDTGLGRYDMVIGRDLMIELGLDTLGSNQSIVWDDAAIPWREYDSTLEDAFMYDLHGADNHPFTKEVRRMSEILDAKYEKADLKAISENASHLSVSERQQLHTLLLKYEDIFDGNLGTWKGDPYDIKLKANAEPYHARPFGVPHIYELTLKTEIERLVKLGVLKKVNRSQWGAPTFIIPKKDGTVRFMDLTSTVSNPEDPGSLTPSGRFQVWNLARPKYGLLPH
jgi:hypothetical protein